MLDLGGMLSIKCKAEDKESISALLIDRMAFLYANSCCLGYGEDESEEHNQKVRDYVSDEICVIEETEDGIFAEIIDIQSGCECLVWELNEENSYMDEFEYNETLTYKYAFDKVFEAFPYIDMEAGLTISYHYSGSRFEIYHTENGNLIREFALQCAGCGDLFVPDKGFWYSEDWAGALEQEGTVGLCSRECAEKLLDEPDSDDYGIIDEYEDEIRAKLED